MTADLLLNLLAKSQAAGGLAILLILALRRPARRWVGPELSYALWAIAPMAALAGLFPTLSQFLRVGPMPLAHWPWAALVLQIWLAGVLVAAAAVILAEVLFRRAASRGLVGPAVMGVTWPRIVAPADYAVRFDPTERGLIERHERMHIARRDPRANLLIAAMRVLSWFNPLAHLAAACARLDQELACDAAVMETFPACRRQYAATLLKAHLAVLRSPVACAWRAAGRHPLELRLAMLSRPSLTIAQYLRGAGLVGLVGAAAIAGMWIIAP